MSAAGGPLAAATALDPSRAEQTHVQPVWLPGGTGLLYVANVAGGRQDVMVTSGDAARGQVLVEGVPRLSPDGSRVAYVAIDEQSGQRDIWIGDLKRGTRTRLTLARGASTDPVWTPDGQAVTYASIRDEGSLAIFTSPADGSREPTRLTRGSDPDRFLFPRAWLRDGRALVFHAIKTSDDVGILRAGSGTEEMLLSSPFTTRTCSTATPPTTTSPGTGNASSWFVRRPKTRPCSSSRSSRTGTRICAGSREACADRPDARSLPHHRRGPRTSDRGLLHALHVLHV